MRWASVSGAAGLALAASALIAAPASATVQFTKQWAGSPEFNSPIGVAVDSSGNSYVADGDNNRIEKVDPDGVLIRTWGGFGSGDGKLKTPESVALDSSGNVYVAELINNRISEFSHNGAFLRTWGWGVQDGSAAFQVCTAGCQAGSSGAGDGQFHFPRGIAINSSGDVYVTDAGNDRVQEFDSSTSRNFIAKWGTSGSGSSQFSNPFAVATDSANNVYVADTGNSRVQEFDSSGVFVSQWGGAGSSEGQFVAPRGIAIDGSDNVYVADSNNDRVQKFDATAAHQFVSTWGYGVSDGFANFEVCTASCHEGIAGSSAQQFNLPIGIATDASDDVFVVDSNNSRVQAFDSSGSPFVPFANRFGGSGSNGDFGRASGVATDPSDNVIVADPLNSRLAKFDGSGVRLVSVAGPGSGQGQVMAPGGVATDASGNVYVADFGNQRIEKFDSGGSFVVMWGKGVNQTTGGNVCDGSGGDVCGAGAAGSGDGEFNQPSAVAVDPSGSVYVADTGNDRIQKFTGSGAYLSQWGSHGSGAGQMDAAQGVAVDSANNVYVADYNNRRIDVFSDAGTFKRAWGWGVQNGSSSFQTCTSGCQAGLSGTGDGEFIAMSSVATDSFNNVYVPDCSRDDIQVFRPTGDFVKKWGSSGSGDGQFDCPGHVTTDGSLIYASDFEGQRVEKFTETDTTSPDTSIDGGPPSHTNDTTPSFTFSSTEPSSALFECRIDSSAENAYVSCSPGFTPAPLGEGSHTFDVRAIDSAGNPDGSPATSTFTVDTTPPDTMIAAGPSGPTADRTPTYNFTATETGSSFMCKIDSHAFAACNSPKTTLPLADGIHSFYVKATDLAGNPDATAAHRSVKVDTHRPASTASAPASTHRSPFNVTYTASDPSPSTGLSLVELWARRPGQAKFTKVATDTTAQATRSFSYTPRAGAGTYRFYTRAKDKAGNYEAVPGAADASTAFSR
jgi:tripartite motif-containing protein 71